jgi:hypothetical protein
VVNHYDGFRKLNLTEAEKGHVVEYLKSLPTVAISININNSEDFVTQHYRDFLGREPDAGGLAFWTNEIESCGSDEQCRELKRINVSAAFFLSIEFQETGFLVYRAYKAAFGNMPGAPVPLRLGEFLPDKQEISSGVVIGQPGAGALLEQNTVAYFDEFVRRARFAAAYPATLTPEQYVDALNANSGGALTSDERQAAIEEFGGAATSADEGARARSLRRVAENGEFARLERNRAFVLMQYFGYLRRNPNDAPDTDFGGYFFWLNKLEQFGGNFVSAEMVKAFILSLEYQRRFGV